LLARRGLTAFESYVVTEFAARYLCPQDNPQASTDVNQALLGNS
jgi:hypothetical protein